MPVGPGNQFSSGDKIVDEGTAVLFGHSHILKGSQANVHIKFRFVLYV